MGIPWDGMGWDGRGIICCGMGWDRKICPMDKPANWPRLGVTGLYVMPHQALDLCRSGVLTPLVSLRDGKPIWFRGAMSGSCF